MGTTARGLHYPEPTDRVADGAAAIQTLAEDVDAALGASQRASGYFGPAAANASGDTVVTHGLGTTPTRVYVTDHSTAGGFARAQQVIAKTATTFTVRHWYNNAANGGGTVAFSWTAEA